MGQRVRMGTSGWSYDHWTPELYEPGLPVARRRDVYTAQFDTVELNASFYRWPAQRSFELWGRVLPEGFAMTVKAPRGMTHGSLLRSAPRWHERLEAAWAALGDRAGVFLVQLSPSHPCELDVLDRFLAELPPRLRVAVEFRHDSWHHEDTQEVLRRHGAAYVVTSGAHLPCHLWATSDLVYVRFHGPDPHHLYGGEYSEEELGWWADRCREWLDDGREVWGYFNNDNWGAAVRNARRLRELLGA